METGNHQALPHGYVLQGEKNRYIIERVLGQGSFGITYLARFKATFSGSLGSASGWVHVAVKEFFMRDINSRDVSTGRLNEITGESLCGKYRRAFLREAHNLANLIHPGIVSVLEVIESNNTVYIVMEYINGGSLDEHIVQAGRLTEEESIDSMLKLCSAVGFMHERKMLHLDIKPKNVMLDEDGELYLIDFGLSKQYTSDGEPESSTTIGLGTPGYAPGEQAMRLDGDKRFRATLDIYALGATMFKMLTGKTPPNASQVSDSALDGDNIIPKLLKGSGISDNLVSVVTKAMWPSSRRRYQTIKEMVDDIEDAKASILGTSVEDEDTLIAPLIPSSESIPEPEPELVLEPEPEPKPKPEPESEPEPEAEPEAKPEPESEPESEPEPEAEPEPEPEAEPEPEPVPEPEPEPVPEPEPEPEPEPKPEPELEAKPVPVPKSEPERVVTTSHKPNEGAESKIDEPDQIEEPEPAPNDEPIPDSLEEPAPVPQMEQDPELKEEPLPNSSGESSSSSEAESISDAGVEPVPGLKVESESAPKVEPEPESKDQKPKFPKWLYAVIAAVVVVIILLWVKSPRNIPLKSISFDKTTLSLVEGDTSVLTIKYNPSDATNKNTAWVSSDTTVAIVNDNGIIAAVKEGNTIISASCGDKKIYCNVIVASNTIEVSSISLSMKSLTLVEGETSVLVATISPANASENNISWKSSNTKVATVNKNGKITAVKAGSVKITASSGKKSATCNLDVIDTVEDDADVVEDIMASNEDNDEWVYIDQYDIVEVEPEPEEEEVFMVVEDQPEFPGGTAALLEYLRKNIKYPAICRENNIQGRVIVSFIVNRDGSIVDLEVVKSVNPSLDKEALRVVACMPKWKPGSQRGKPVRVKYTIPVNFRLN